VVFGAICLDLIVFAVRNQLGWNGNGIHLTGISIVLIVFFQWMQRGATKLESGTIAESFENLKQTFKLPNLHLKRSVHKTSVVSHNEDSIFIQEKALQELSPGAVNFLIAREMAGIPGGNGISAPISKRAIVGGAILFSFVSLFTYGPRHVLLSGASCLILGYVVVIIYEKVYARKIERNIDEKELAKDYLALQATGNSEDAIEALHFVSSGGDLKALRMVQINAFADGKPRESYSNSKIEARLRSVLISLPCE
jgi:hypothetical protein